jgi:hypothetical protein
VTSHQPLAMPKMGDGARARDEGSRCRLPCIDSDRLLRQVQEAAQLWRSMNVGGS